MQPFRPHNSTCQIDGSDLRSVTIGPSKSLGNLTITPRNSGQAPGISPPSGLVLTRRYPFPIAALFSQMAAEGGGVSFAGVGGGGGRRKAGSESEAEARRARRESIPPYLRSVSGSLGGIMEACCLQPIDVIKTRLQLDRTGNYRGIAHCGATVARTEGVRALWKGLTPFATHLTLKYALRMGSNALFQSAFKDPATGHLSNRARVLSGFGAGVLEALVIVTPFEASPLFFFYPFFFPALYN